MDTLLEARGLKKSYGNVAALKGIDLRLMSGRIVGMLGPNGSGKTTLIKIACRLLQPTEGQILIDGEAPGPVSKSKIAYLPDKDFLPDWMKTRQLLQFYEDFYADFDRNSIFHGLRHRHAKPNHCR